MITIFDPLFNGHSAEDREKYLTQEYYDACINVLQLIQLICPACGLIACLTVHGYYDRYVKINEEKTIRLRILRVMCSHCHTTHAILLASIVPYSQIPLVDQVAVIEKHAQGETASAIADEVPSVDENAVKRILKAFVQVWIQRILSESIPLSPIPTLVRECFAFYSLQFMQIKFTYNKLFQRPT